MTVFHTYKLQIVRTDDDGFGRRRATEEQSQTATLVNKVYSRGKGKLLGGQTVELFIEAETLFLNSTNPVTVVLADPATGTVESTTAGTRVFSFDLATGSKRVTVVNEGEDTVLNWFAFDNFGAGNISQTMTLQEQIDAANAAITQLQTDLGVLQTTVNNIDTASMQAALTAIDGRLDANETNIASLQTSLTALQNQLTLLQTAVNENDNDISGLNTQLVTINGTLSTLQTSVAQLQTAVAQNTSNVTALTATVASHTSSINDLTTRVQSLQSQIQSNDADILSLQTLTATLEQETDDNTAAVLGLTADVTALTEQGFPFSFGPVLPDNTQVARFVLPYDIKVKAQNTVHAVSLTPPSATSTMDIRNATSSIGTVTYDTAGNGTVVVANDVNIAEGESLYVITGTVNDMVSPSFTLLVDRII